MRIKIIGTFALVSLAATVHAAEPQDTTPFFVLSEGVTTCGEFISQPQNRNHRIEWVLGFISGLNAGANGPNREVGHSLEDAATVDGWLQSYCSAHALDRLVAAGLHLREDFVRHELHK